MRRSLIGFCIFLAAVSAFVTSSMSAEDSGATGAAVVAKTVENSGAPANRQPAEEVAELPDAPVPMGQSSSVVVNGAEGTPVQHQDPQTKRILGIFPNFRAVSVDAKLPPQTVKEKFVTASEDSFDYSALVLPALLAGYGQLENQTPEFHQGAAAYGRYFWHTFTDQTIENYMVEFIVPTVTREDTRYYTLGRGGFFKRSGYALSRVVVTRTDSDTRSFNYSEVVGAGAAAAISNSYYPAADRDASNTLTRWATNVGIDAGTFVIREFWPDVNHYLFHGDSTMQVPPK